MHHSRRRRIHRLAFSGFIDKLAHYMGRTTMLWAQYVPKCAAYVGVQILLARMRMAGYTAISRPNKSQIELEIEGNDNGLHPRH